MISTGVKGFSTVIVAWLTYLNNTFTPLFWVLLALVALDMFLNVHREGQQFYKIGSMAITLGVPSYVTANLGNPSLGKYLVAIMCLVYLQIVVPQLLAKVGSWKFSQDPTQNAMNQDTVKALLERVQAIEQAKAEQLLQSSQKAPTVIQDGKKE